MTLFFNCSPPICHSPSICCCCFHRFAAVLSKPSLFQSFLEDHHQSGFAHHVDGKVWIFSPAPAHIGTHSPPFLLVATIFPPPPSIQRVPAGLKKGDCCNISIAIYPLPFLSQLQILWLHMGRVGWENTTGIMENPPHTHTDKHSVANNLCLAMATRAHWGIAAMWEQPRSSCGFWLLK